MLIRLLDIVLFTPLDFSLGGGVFILGLFHFRVLAGNDVSKLLLALRFSGFQHGRTIYPRL